MMWMLPQDIDLGMHVDGSDMDIVSFDDSEQFEEEDSVCSSWISDADQVAYWSGWKESTHSTDVDEKEIDNVEVLTLMELSAKCVAMNYAFEVVEQHNPPIPEALQLRIAFWSFPESEEEIRLYSCLACGSNEKFKQGDFLAKSGHVTEVLQIGFHLIGVVTQPVAHSIIKQKHSVSITFDRCHITSCKCSCSEGATWCEHAIALCIYRIVKRKDVSLRAPVSESLARLERDQLQKFAQYLISEHPQQIRMAQKLLDELLSSKQSEINLQDGAPDPTAGASTSDDAKWVLDEAALRENIKKILARCCGCLPLVVVDVNSSFLTSAPPVSLEWSNFIRSFQGHDPEAMWNLLSIVRHMFARCDHNATLLLNFITEECLLCYQMMFYWLSSYSSLQGNSKPKAKADNTHGTLHPNNDLSRHASAHLMEEVVHLWELAVMTPYMLSAEKSTLKTRFENWNKQIIEAAKTGQGQGLAMHPPVRKTEDFLGFAPAIKACDIDWDVYYEILGISEALLKELTFKGRSTKLDDFTDSMVEKMYQEISTMIPPDMDEFVLVTKLTHSLCCHGFVNKACKLASELARKIVSGYPERINRGELNFASITEKADSLCNILLKCLGNERIVFEIAILGLTVPRFPAPSNMEEVKLSYLEMALYQKLTNIIITDERLAFIRFQGRKVLANPMLRGDAVLPLIITTYIFEVLCIEHVASNVLRGKTLRFTSPNPLTEDDNFLGYQCALVVLGSCSSAVDHKQPMLCESIRHHRRDLALALLTHCKTDDRKIDEVITVILDKERHGFMRSKQVNHNVVKWTGKEDGKKTKSSNDDIYHAQDTKLQTKYGFSFEQVKKNGNNAFTQNGRFESSTKNQNTRQPGNAGVRGHAAHPGGAGSPRGRGSHPGSHAGSHAGNSFPRRHERAPKISSDSDSGHGEGGDKRLLARNLNVPVTNSRKSQQQRRQFRQNNNKARGDKSTRSDRASTWVKFNKSAKTKKWSKSKPSREMTESDSGQEMHFSFEGDVCAPPAIENWDDEIESRKSMSSSKEKSEKSGKNRKTPREDISLAEYLPVYKNLPTEAASLIQSHKDTCSDNDAKSEGWGSTHQLSNDAWPETNSVHDDNKTSRWSLSSPDDVAIDTHENALSEDLHKLSNLNNLCGSNSNNSAAAAVAPVAAIPSDNIINDSEPTSDLGDDDDFNIEADMFHATLVEKIPSIDNSPMLSEADEYIEAAIIQNAPTLSETDEYLEATIIQNVLDNSPLSTTIHTSTIHTDEIPSNTVKKLPLDIQDDVVETTTDTTNSPDDGVMPVIVDNVFFQQPTSDIDIIENKTEELKIELADVLQTDEVESTEIIPIIENTGRNSSSSQSHEENVIVISNDDSAPDTQLDSVDKKEISTVPNSEHSSSTDLNDNVQAIGSSSVILDDKSSVTDKIENTVELDDLREALESVCVDQTAANSCPLDEAPPLVTQPTGQVVKPKKKPKKNKKSKARVSMNMQSIEAEAYSLFELAKSVLQQARTNNTFSADVDEVITNNAINKRLQLAAFEIGLFALNVHNYSSPNWFSRTYSSYVSWIENQAVEVGSAAIHCLNEKWEGVLTPSESVQIATRASRSGDSVMRRKAAELALSCLPYSQNLSPVDITQTITLCKEQDTGMLERACSAVENAGRHGGVQPELLFLIAREWHYLHEENQKLSGGSEDENFHSQNGHVNGASNSNRVEGDPVYMTPEQFVQEQMHQQAQEILGRQLPRNMGPDQLTWIYPQYYGPLHHCPLPQQAIHSRRIPNIDSYAVPISNFPDELNISEIPRYLQNSYRVGIRALEALTLRMPDETPDVKFALAPPSSDDIRWMCALSAKLGPPYLKIFCKIVYNAVTSPYLLHDLALEAARHFALYNPAQLASHLRSPSVSPIVQKALAMYTELVQYDLILLGSSGYPDFVELLRKTRSAFCMAPGGMARFNEILEVVRKSYPKKRELWQLIMNGLSKA